MTFQLFYQSGNYFIAHVCKGEIRIKNKVIKLQKYCLKNESNSVPITHAQIPTIKNPNRTSTMHEGEEL